MKLTEQQEKWLVFGLGMLFSFRSIPKAYAPTVNIPTPPQSPKDICEKGGIRGIWREYTQAPSFKNDGGWCDCHGKMRRNPQSQSDCPQGTEFRLGEPWNICFNPLTAVMPQNTVIPPSQAAVICQTNLWAEKPVLKCPPGTRQYSYTKNAGILSNPPLCHTCGNEAEIYKQKQLDTIMGIV